jgi:hypothetical protein
MEKQQYMKLNHPLLGHIFSVLPISRSTEQIHRTIGLRMHLHWEDIQEKTDDMMISINR